MTRLQAEALLELMGKSIKHFRRSVSTVVYNICEGMKVAPDYDDVMPAIARVLWGIVVERHQNASQALSQSLRDPDTKWLPESVNQNRTGVLGLLQSNSSQSTGQSPNPVPEEVSGSAMDPALTLAGPLPKAANPSQADPDSNRGIAKPPNSTEARPQPNNAESQNSKEEGVDTPRSAIEVGGDSEEDDDVLIPHPMPDRNNVVPNPMPDLKVVEFPLMPSLRKARIHLYPPSK